MKISIYLENNLLDTNEDSIIALTLCYSYVEDPTTIAGDYSKTISIPGTVNNNRIFGHIWNIDREILNATDGSNTGVHFNASKRTEAKIFMDNDLFKKGYVQLNTINKNNGKISYEITFFSELCNMLHSIMDSSLGTLEFPGKLAHIINSESLEKNIKNIGPIIENSTANLSDYVKYGLSIDGVFDNFNADKWLTWDTTNKKYVIADIDNNGTNYDTAMLFEAPSNRIRPYIKISSLLNQIRDDYNSKNDIKLSFNDPYFFNSSNPYVSKLVMSGKTYDTDNNQSGTTALSFDDFSVSNNDTVTIKAKGEYADLNGVMDFSSLSVIPHITLEAMLAFNGVLNQNGYSQAVSSAVYSYGRQFTVNDSIVPLFFLAQVNDDGTETGTIYNMYMENYVVSEHTNYNIYLGQDKDSHNTVITPLIYETTRNTNTFELAFKNCVFRDTQTYLDCSETPCRYVETHVYDKKYTNLSSEYGSPEIDDYSTDNNDKQGVTDFFPFRFSYSNLKPGKYILKVRIKTKPSYLKIRNYADYPFGDDKINIGVTSLTMRGRFNTKFGVNELKNGNSQFIYRNWQPLQAFIANTLEDTTVDTTSGVNWSMSTGAGTVPGSIVSFNDMVDSETTQGDFLVNYTKLFGLVYDSDSVNDDSTIRICSRNYYHRDYKIIDWTDKIDYSQSFKQVPLSFNTKYLTLNYNPSESYYAKKYSSTYDMEYGTQLVDTGYEFNADSSALISNQMFTQCIPVKNEGLMRGIAPGFFDKDNNERSPIDGQYSLLFWDDTTFRPQIMVYDDNEIFHNESIGGDENMCFVDSSALKEHGGLALHEKYLNIPAPQALLSSSYGTVSTDLGYPRSSFAGYTVASYPSSGTIYSGYWDNYIRSLYDPNTQIITAYVYLKPVEVLKFSFKNFIKIKDTLWHPNKITDYNPLSQKPVQVELVKVNDINAYTNSSIKWYEYFRAEFNVYSNDSTVQAAALLTPNTGGVVTGSSANQYYGNYLYGTQWTQSFSYVQPYNGIDKIEAFYYDEFGVKQDCSEWFNISTLTFTCRKPVPSDITVNIKVVESGVQYYSVSTLLENAKATWVEPSQETTRLRQGSPLAVELSSLFPNDESYKFNYCTVTENSIDKTNEYFNKSTMTVKISSISGNVVINCSYLQFEDVLLPWIGSGNVSGNAAYFDTSVSIIPTNSHSYSIYCGGSYTGNDSNNYFPLIYAQGKVADNSGSGIPSSYNDVKCGIGMNSAQSFGQGFSYQYPSTAFDNFPVSHKFNINTESSKINYFRMNSGSNVFMQSYASDWYNVFALNERQVFKAAPSNSSFTSYVKKTTFKIFKKDDANAATNMRLSFLELCPNDALTTTNRFTPMMHYFDYGYAPCLYDAYTGEYLNAVYAQYLEYDLDDQSDIPVQWISSTAVLDGTSPTGSCYFNTNVFMEETTDASVGFEINASLHYVNQETVTLFHTTPEIVELDEEGRHILISNRVDVTNKTPTMYYGAYNASNTEIPDYQMYTLQYGNMANDVRTRISIMPIKKAGEWTAAMKVQGKGTSGSSEQIIKTGHSNVFLFKNMNNNSAPQGIRLFSFAKFTGYGNTFKYTNNLVPVLHFTGTKEVTVSNEGIKAPIGYVPCLYDTITGEYCYASGGKPTWGLRHNS